jgi:hypothetical protein
VFQPPPPAFQCMDDADYLMFSSHFPYSTHLMN